MHALSSPSSPSVAPRAGRSAATLDGLLATRRLWRGQPMASPMLPSQPTGHAALDDVLPTGGWPERSLSEILVQADGTGELALVWPTLARLTQAGARVVLIAPPYCPHAPAWHSAGLALRQVQVVEAAPRDALWAAEQCLRSAACKAVLCWPRKVDDRSLRRLATASADGQCLGLVFRPLHDAAHPSPAALRLALEPRDRTVRVLKCRGGMPPTCAIALGSVSR